MPRICNQKCSKLKLKIYFLAKPFFVDLNHLIILNTFHNWIKELKSIFTRQEINKIFDDVVKKFVDFLTSKYCSNYERCLKWWDLQKMISPKSIFWVWVLSTFDCKSEAYPMFLAFRRLKTSFKFFLSVNATPIVEFCQSRICVHHGSSISMKSHQNDGWSCVLSKHVNWSLVKH